MQVEKFHSTGSQILGGIGVALALLFAAALVFDGRDGSDGVLLCVIGFFGVLVWSAMVRPQVRLAGDRIFLRDMVSTVSFSLAAIEAVEVRQVLVLRAGGRRFISAAVSKSLYQVLKDNRGVARDDKLFPNFVENRIRSRSEDERAKLGASRGEVPLDLKRTSGVARDRADGALRGRGSGLPARVTVALSALSVGCARLFVVDAAQVVAMSEELPDVVLKEHSRWTSITYRGKGFAWVDHGENAAMIKGTHEERAACVATDPETFSEGWASATTAWIRACTWRRADAQEIFELLAEGWRMTAPKAAVAAYDAAQGLTG